MTSDLDGRTALVTGGAGGIGLACVRALAAAGAKVHVVDIDGDRTEAVAAEVGGWAHVADLTDAATIGALPAEVDLLVNNAGIQHVAPLEDFPPDVFTRIQSLMVTAPFLLIRHMLPSMYARGWGRIVNMSSVHGLRASPYKAAYVAAKHGLEGLSKVAALEGAAHGVTSNCVNPGYVRTPLVDNQIDAQAIEHDIPREDVVSEVLLKRAAIKKLIEADDVASLVTWLCSPHAGHVTGASIPLDGGWTAA
ncbi:D-beta-hydroxybutyrate dehydrogenase (EC [Amycolatopsis camponoti]|uniref:D-beta-hydroxybutyrate dehydrogenase (EC) n=1 Tax=Amycolatopsis camponoti TaxID=2606593 RepID=A0A6I8LVU2_9PSEU|nr:3-hydroxybutyrate dehydrogenase [Amycolatopsis camponoti]VVJ21322.1 D-beta-hydroxybutyrate dehydrogenase (EC [Amycolatopsis camponoti]